MIGELPSEGRHCVVCDEAGNRKTRFSEPVELESPSDWGEITEEGFGHHPTSARLAADLAGETVGQGAENQRRPTTIRAQLAEFTEKVVTFALETPTVIFQEFHFDDVPILGFISGILTAIRWE